MERGQETGHWTPHGTAVGECNAALLLAVGHGNLMVPPHPCATTACTTITPVSDGTFSDATFAPKEMWFHGCGTSCDGCTLPPPPPCRSPPLVVPRGGWGASLGQPKNFRCGSLCSCVGGCVVGHYHLHPLHSWQDILLTFAEMELDNTTMFPPGTSVMFIRSTGEPVLAQVVGHSEHGQGVGLRTLAAL